MEGGQVEEETEADQSQEGKESAEGGEDRIDLRGKLHPQHMQGRVARREVARETTVVAEEGRVLANEVDYEEREGVEEKEREASNG